YRCRSLWQQRYSRLRSHLRQAAAPLLAEANNPVPRSRASRARAVAEHGQTIPLSGRFLLGTQDEDPARKRSGLPGCLRQNPDTHDAHDQAPRYSRRRGRSDMQTSLEARDLPLPVALSDWQVRAIDSLEPSPPSVALTTSFERKLEPWRRD